MQLASLPSKVAYNLQQPYLNLCFLQPMSTCFLWASFALALLLDNRTHDDLQLMVVWTS